ncbi:MAG: Rhomboid family protein [Myxococcales bacterium]|nr:Rhomboid family protein [Myxococcales bacterium]
MTWELGVVMAASLLALQLVTLVTRRGLKDELPYACLLAADLALLIFAQATQRQSMMVGVAGTLAALILVFGPRLADRLEHRAFARDDLGRALAAAKLREILAPGLGAMRRRRQLANLVEARAGGAAQVLSRLDAELGAAREGKLVNTLLIERATVLFLAGRFRECVDATRKLPGDWPAAHPVLGAYVVRAHAELGELAHAAAILNIIEEGVAGRDPGGLSLLVQARLTLLAFAGRQTDVDRLLAGEARTMLSDPAAQFLHDTARDRAGQQLAPAMGPILDDVAVRTAEAARPLIRPRGRAPVTIALVVANVLVALVATRFAIEPQGSVLIRWGALFRPAVQGGEWWRAFTAMFLHGGPWHLGLNMYALYMLGRFCEEIFGPLRYFVTYVAAGLIGAIGSTLNTQQGGLSVGASGAIMGVLGALIVVLILRRGTWPERWRRTLLWNLVMLGALQIYVGFQLPMIDNAAHVGGMLGGGATALVVAPGGILGRSSTARALVAALAVALFVGFAWAGVEVARTPLERTFDKLPTRVINAGGRAWRVPAYWEFDAEDDVVRDPYFGITLPREPQAPVAADPALRRLYDHIETRAGSP